MIRGSVLIIDDDELYRLELEMALSKYDYEIWLSTGTTREVFRHLRERSSRPDILLVDVRLKEQQNGISLAEKLKVEQIPVIFLTAFPQEDQFQKALKVIPAAYFIKPVRPLELHHAIQLALKASPRKENFTEEQIHTAKTLSLRDKDNFIHEVPIEQIYAVESYGNLLIFHTLDERYLLRQTLKKMAEILKAHEFVRIHKSYLIARRFWKKKLPLGKTVMVAGRQFPVGRFYRARVLNLLKD